LPSPKYATLAAMDGADFPKLAPLLFLIKCGGIVCASTESNPRPFPKQQRMECDIVTAMSPAPEKGDTKTCTVRRRYRARLSQHLIVTTLWDNRSVWQIQQCFLSPFSAPQLHNLCDGCTVLAPLWLRSGGAKLTKSNNDE
jgi:hypothetical protein